MGVIFGLLLIVLGLLSAQDFFGEKIPAFKSTLEKINSYAEFIGLAGLLCGFIWLLQALSFLRFIGVNPMLAIVTLVGAFLTLTLGMIFGLPLLHKFMNEPTPGILIKADKWAAGLQPHRKILGFVAIAFGIFAAIP